VGRQTLGAANATLGPPGLAGLGIGNGSSISSPPKPNGEDDFEMVERPSMDDPMARSMARQGGGGLGGSGRKGTMRKKNKPTVQFAPVQASPLMGGGGMSGSRSGKEDATSPKQSWFAGLFNWKNLVRPFFFLSFLTFFSRSC
jgi:hypothetical protein